MSRTAGIDLIFTSDLRQAKSEFSTWAQDIETRGITVPIRIGGDGANAGNVATFGNPGGVMPTGGAGAAAARLETSPSPAAFPQPINQSAAQLPGAIPQGTTRAVHMGAREISDSIAANGLNYSSQGMITSTARTYGPGSEAEYTSTDPRFAGGRAYVFDMPNAVAKLHNDPTRSPGVVPPEYYKGYVEGGQFFPAGSSATPAGQQLPGAIPPAVGGSSAARTREMQNLAGEDDAFMRVMTSRQMGMRRDEAFDLLRTLQQENPSITTADDLVNAGFARLGSGKPIPRYTPPAPTGAAAAAGDEYSRTDRVWDAARFAGHVGTERSWDQAAFSKFKQDEKTVEGYKDLFYDTKQSLKDEEIQDYRSLARRTVRNLGGRMVSSADMEAFQLRDVDTAEPLDPLAGTRIGRLKSQIATVSNALESSRGTPAERAVNDELKDLRQKEAIMEGRAEAPAGAGGMNRFQSLRLLTIGITAAHELIQLGQGEYQSEYQGQVNDIMAGGNPVRQAQAAVQAIAARQQLQERVASFPLFGAGAVIGGVIGSMIMPGFGTVAGAAIGSALGQGVGSLGYRAVMNDANAKEMGKAEREAAYQQLRSADVERANAGFGAFYAQGQSGPGAEIAGVFSDRNRLNFERSRRVRDFGEGSKEVRSLDEGQTAERMILDNREREVITKTSIARIGLMQGPYAMQVAALEHDQEELRRQIIPGADSTIHNQAVFAALGLDQDKINDLTVRRAAATTGSTDALRRSLQGALTRNPLEQAKGERDARQAQIDATAAPEDRGWMTQQNRMNYEANLSTIGRDNFEGADDMRANTTVSSLRRRGFGLESKLADAEQWRNTQLRMIGGTGMEWTDRLFGFTDRRQAVEDQTTEMRKQANADFGASEILERGSLKATRMLLNDDPLSARLEGIRAKGEAERLPLDKDSIQYKESVANQLADTALATQQFDNNRRMVNLGLDTTALATGRMLRHDPIGAQTAQIVGQTIQEANRLAFAGMPDEAEKERQNGLQALKLTKQNYLDAFGGKEVDIRSLNLRNPRDVTNPTEVMNTIAADAARLEREKFGSKPNEEDTVALKGIHDLVQLLSDNIAKLASASQ